MCFAVLNEFANFSSAMDLCFDHRSRILSFNNVDELEGFMDLLASGKACIPNCDCFCVK